MIFKNKYLLLLTLLIGAGFTWWWLPGTKVDFNRQIKPLINKHCITCHGGVKREGDFSLLFRRDALQKTKSGKYAIVPGKPEQSEMIRRLTTQDLSERMPYRHDALAASEIDLLRKWIQQGANWGDHWAYVLPKSVKVPRDLPAADASTRSKLNSWVQRDLDYFVANRLAENKMSPSPAADKATLLRRVSLDLTGLPASEQLAQSFLQNNHPKAYETLVDSLLVSPHFGEKWATMWLDLARYADTKGYERDDSRQIWRYRDWVIRAFNADKPYDEFLTEQIAGDLLPGASEEQLIATAFHRNTMTNDEGGTDNEEFRTAATIDRVNTTWEALMGTTFSCVQCHSHPYDPFRHEDYYRMMAYFNNSADQDTYEEFPLLRHFQGKDSADLAYLQQWMQANLVPQQQQQIEKFVKTLSPVIYSLNADSFTQSELADTKWLVLRNNALCRLQGVTLTGKTQLMFKCHTGRFDNRWTIHVGSPDGPVLATTVVRPAKDGQPLVTQIPIKPFKGKYDLYFRLYSPQLTEPDETALRFDWFNFTEEFPGMGQPGYEKARQAYWSLIKASSPTTPIMLDNAPEYYRQTRVFVRGNWLDKGEEIQPGVPASLHPMPKGAPDNRLGLAQWITDERNPLTARTLVNRVWEQLYGTGLAETVEDLGSQGIPPIHQDLLDYLALRFMQEHHWSIKALIKDILLSATYRQDSATGSDQLDPENRYLGRGPRTRLTAEQIRDQALVLSGLFQDKMYGPGVMPYQPAGIWQSPWNGADWVESKGEDRYRRAVYTYWKRSSPYPSMMSFDGVSREVCVARRIRTNTPLQALVTMNDDAYIEMSVALAKKMQAAGPSPVEAVSKAYEWAFYRPIDPARLKILMVLYNKALLSYQQNKDGIKTLLVSNQEAGSVAVPPDLGAETAALAIVANAILNLDEMIMKG